jgi:hypothetical protein
MFEIMITEEESRELLDLIEEELGDPLAGRKTALISRVAKKIRKSQQRVVGKCERSGEDIFLDEYGNPETRTLKCNNSECEYVWESWFFQTNCPKCGR